MATFDRREIVSALTRKGFRLEESSGRHDTLIFEHGAKKDTIRTEVSRGSAYKEIGDPLLGMMKRDLSLTRDQFYGLIKCPLKREDLLEIYRSKGLLPPREPKVQKSEPLSKERREEVKEKIEDTLNKPGVDEEVARRLSILYGIFEDGRPTTDHAEAVEDVLEKVSEES